MYSNLSEISLEVVAYSSKASAGVVRAGFKKLISRQEVFIVTKTLTTSRITIGNWIAHQKGGYEERPKIILGKFMEGKFHMEM